MFCATTYFTYVFREVPQFFIDIDTLERNKPSLWVQMPSIYYMLRNQ